MKQVITSIRYCLVIVSLILFVSFANASATNTIVSDFVIDECPDVIQCIDGSGQFEGVMQAGELNSPDLGNCTGWYNFQQNLKFEATSNEVDILIEWGNNEEMIAGLIDVCYSEPSWLCIVGSDCETDGEINLSTDELIVGHTYILFVDNCLTVDEWTYYATITLGDDDEFNSISGLGLKESETCENGLNDDLFCYGVDLVPVFFSPYEREIVHLTSSEAIWEFQLRGTVTEGFIIDDISDFKLNLEAPGEYTLELISIELNCNSYEIGVQYDFEIVDVNEDFGVYDVCTHDLEEWTPGEFWLGPSISEAGEYQHWFQDECGCDYYQSIRVIELEEQREEVILELCPDDYPYDYFDEYELTYFPDDYDLMLTIYQGSLQEDWDRDPCDSLVHLFVINENPEDRCSSCELPVSLEKSKIIYCVPFDNGTFDVSGRANQIYPVGVGYENNGPASNRLWEAEFDGRDDHVWIPHFDDLNTSAFAIDIRFNKDAAFENGEPESLISKGDLSEDNKRFDLRLEEKTENSFDLIAECFTDSEIISITVPDLLIGEWYGTTLVVQEDSVSLYMNGELFETQLKSEDLRGNDHNMYLATGEKGGALSNFYDGRLDDFKYWKQKLSGQDILYLYFPEKEFEVQVDVFLRCCESAEIFDFVIDQNNPNDTLIIEKASPTGYDSVYYVNMIPVEVGPVLDSLLIPEDIVINKIIACNESCSQLVEWEEPPLSVFNDICGIAMIESSHSSPFLLDENISYLEVEYTATNLCGGKSSFSFVLELQCEPEDFTLLPQGNDFVIENSMSCDDGELFCKGGDMRLKVFSHDSTQIDPMLYDSLRYRLRINGVDLEVWVDDQEDFEVELDIDAVGIHEICYVSLSSDCEEVEVKVCKQIEIIEGFEIDHGTVIACQGSIEEVLPEDMGDELLNYLLVSGEGGLVESITEDDCSCRSTERIRVIYRDEEIAEHRYDICEGELPIQILGEEFGEEAIYDQTEIVFAGMSRQLDSNGNSCDSTIVLTINVLEEKQTEFNVEICDGEDYNGYTVPGSYTEKYHTEAGCDSTVTVNVFVLEDMEVQISAEICEGEDIFGYTTTGNYVDVLTAMNGCDSVRILDLTVHENSIEELFIEICPDEEYNGYTESGLYEENYISSTGCDSTIFIQLTALAEDHEDCFVSSVAETELQNIRIYPNPTDRFLNIDSKIGLRSIKLYNTAAQEIWNQRPSDTHNRVELNEIVPGMYFIVIETADGQTKIDKLIIN